MKALKPIIALLAIGGLGFWVFYVMHSRSFQPKLDKAHALYNEGTREALAEARTAYEALKAEAMFGKELAAAEAGVACCDALDAWYDIKQRFHRTKYDKVMPLLKRALELTGDEQGEWAKRIEEVEQSYAVAEAPSVADMQATFAAAKKKTPREGLAEIALLARQKERWQSMGMHEGDTERATVFRTLKAYLIKGYREEFQKSVAKAKTLGEWKSKDEDFLRAKVDPLSWLAGLRGQDPAQAAELEKTHADALAEANRAQKQLDALMEAMMP